MKLCAKGPFGMGAAFAAALLAFVGTACGVDSPTYIESVEQAGGSVIQVELTNKATVSLPGSSTNYSSPQFSNWSILYRIYVSGSSPSGQVQTSSGALSQLNPSLASDYASMYPNTDITINTIQNTNIHTIFSNWGYYEIALENAGTRQRANISSVLNASASGRNIVIEFPEPSGSIPSLKVGDTTYNLLRSEGSTTEDGINNKTNSPLPDRYFRNSDDLNSSEKNTNSQKDGYSNNLDVADNSSVTTKRYTYVSLYIIGLGRDPKSFNRISSRPTFIAILKLPEQS